MPVLHISGFRELRKVVQYRRILQLVVDTES
jgi:hypothetical protein